MWRSSLRSTIPPISGSSSSPAGALPVPWIAKTLNAPAGRKLPPAESRWSMRNIVKVGSISRYAGSSAGGASAGGVGRGRSRSCAGRLRMREKPHSRRLPHAALASRRSSLAAWTAAAIRRASESSSTGS